MENIDLVTLSVQLVSGAIGGNIAGALLRGLSLGTLGNSLAGIIGGGVGGHLLTKMLALPAASVAAGMDPMDIVNQAASGAGGGVVVMIVLGVLRSILGK